MPAAANRIARSVGLRYPFLSGQGTLVQARPLRRLTFVERTLLVRLSSGKSLLVFPNDHIGRLAYFFGDVDPKVTELLRSVLDEGDCLVDVGANVGVVSFQCLDRVGPGGRVVAVEPQPGCASMLRESIRLNELANVEVHELALSDHPGEGSLHVPDGSNLGMTTLEGRGEGAIRVRLTTGEAFLDSLEVAGDYVIKIDVEGHEGKVLRGMLGYLRRRPPKAVVFESNSYLYGGTSFFDEPCFDLLSGLGMRLFEIRKSLLKIRLNELTSSDAEPRATDFIAVRDDQVDRLWGRRG
ncbi:FkbM family methyltransferase [Paludisphaera soli]|uniref:FkbM family methyltransferase n=1 Tax=Paludisphaera soli TaxID=2712865 RepID=UPI0013EAB15F|nr:FkbM family methyltransferase [Paludisphaera soli]